MRIQCLLLKPQIERCAVMHSGGEAPARIAEHLSSCPACKQYWNELTGLVRMLPLTMEAPSLTDGFTLRMNEALSSVPRERPANRLGLRFTLAIGAVAATLIAFTFYQRTAWIDPSPFPNPAPSQGTRTQIARSAEPAPVTPEITGQSKSVATDTKRTGKAPTARNRRTSIRRIPRPKQFLVKKMPVNQPPIDRTPIKVASLGAGSTTTSPAKTWTQWGSYYEENGYHQEARAAYEMALQAEDNPETTFAAGRAAEQAGDVSQALEYYGRAMMRSSIQDKKDPQKGTKRWTPERDV